MGDSIAEIAVLFTPIGRDAAVAAKILGEAGMASTAVGSLTDFAVALEAGAGFALVSEEALRGRDLRTVTGFLRSQSEWSDFPFILLTEHGGSIERNPSAARLLETLGNVTFLERPFHPTTLISLSRAALRARRRQYEARSRLTAIRQGEERLRVALSAGALGAWSIDIPDQNLQTSDECKAHYGRSPDMSFTYAELLASIHPDDRAAMQQSVVRSLRGGEDYDVEYRCLWPDGALHWVQVRGRVDHGADGRATRMAGVTLDVTERKRAEAALIESEARFRAAVDAVQGILWTNNAAGEMVGEQPGWSALTGQTFDEYQGYGWAAAVHPEDAGPTLNAWNAAVAARGKFEFEHRVLRHDGQWRDFGVRAIPAIEADGSIREWIGVHTDITEQRLAERQLAAFASHLEDRVREATAELKGSQARMRSIFESSHQYFGELDLDGVLLDANATSLAGINAKLEDVVGRPYWDTPWFSQTPGAPERVRAIVAKVAEGENFNEEVSFLLPGGWRTFDLSMRPVRDERGVIVALVAEATDITERRETEQILIQSQKLETIGQLTGGIAHDFNNLLTPIVGSLDLLRRRLEGDERAQRVAAAGLQSADRAKTLVNRLLAFARKQALDPQAVDIAQLIDGMRDLIDRSIGPMISLDIEASENLPAALIDPNQLELSILNLCVNAKDAMPAGGAIKVTVVSESVVAPHAAGLSSGDYVRISVSDTGIGMDAETVRRAIEPFYTTKEIGKGTGLGLSMVHGLSAQLGGGMAIDSRPGEGTDVTLWLPAVAGGASRSDFLPAPKTTSPNRSATVLLVDDEMLVRFATAEMLRDAGYEVVEATSGPEARELVRAGLTPDILVSDQLMPGMKGNELAAELGEVLPGLRVLLATGYIDLPDLNLPRIAKPFGAAELVERVRALIEEA